MRLLRPFDIFDWKAPGWPEAHPAVIVSHPDRAARKEWVEVVLCASKQATRSAEPHEVVLDQADGLDWPTLCKCDLIYAVPRTEAKRLRGQVTRVRRSQLVRTILAAHGWGAVL
jgi:hypothetical protein